LIDQLEVLALKSVALKDPEYFYRKVCRYYSEKFHTPLLEVQQLPWPFVFTNYLEHVIETNNGTEDIYNLAIDICYPEKRVSDEDELQSWIKRVEKEEEQKRESKKQKELDVEESKETADPPIGEENINMESTSFAHLEEEMEEEEEDG
jgi:uncharacterized membrane protein